VEFEHACTEQTTSHPPLVVLNIYVSQKTLIATSLIMQRLGRLDELPSTRMRLGWWA